MKNRSASKALTRRGRQGKNSCARKKPRPKRRRGVTVKACTPGGYCISTRASGIRDAALLLLGAAVGVNLARR